MPLASIASSMTIGMFLLRYIEATHVIVLGFVAFICCVVFLWITAGSVWGCIALFGALGLVQGASFAAVPQLNEDNRTRAYAYGAVAQMGNLGNLCGTPLLFLISASAGFGGLIVIAFICYALGIAVHIFMFIRRK